MASLGTLTTGIAHEIKNPLNFVNSFSELSMDTLREFKDKVAEAADPSPAIQAMSELIKDLEQNARYIHEHGKRANKHCRTHAGFSAPPHR